MSLLAQHYHLHPLSPSMRESRAVQAQQRNATSSDHLCKFFCCVLTTEVSALSGEATVVQHPLRGHGNGVTSSNDMAKISLSASPRSLFHKSILSQNLSFKSHLQQNQRTQSSPLCGWDRPATSTQAECAPGDNLLIFRSPPTQLPNGVIRSSPRSPSKLNSRSLLHPATLVDENRLCWLSPSAQV